MQKVSRLSHCRLVRPASSLLQYKDDWTSKSIDSLNPNRTNTNASINYFLPMRAALLHDLQQSCSPPKLLSNQYQLKNMSAITARSQVAHISTRFLLISDTHSASPEQKPQGSQNVSQLPLPKADVLLHCGDLTMIGTLLEYEKTLDLLGSIDADLKLVIAGNHDISLDEVYYRRKGQSMQRHTGGYSEDLPAKARELWLGERAKSAGVTYLEEGTHSFTLKNGARLRVE
jgi:hypothetical protein